MQYINYSIITRRPPGSSLAYFATEVFFQSNMGLLQKDTIRVEFIQKYNILTQMSILDPSWAETTKGKILFSAQYLTKWAYFSFLPISDLEWPWMTWRFSSKMFPSMMCTLSWNCYMLQCTHTMLLLKRYKNQPLTPYNSRTGCPIEAEVGVLYRAHINTINGKEKYIYKKNWSTEKQNKKRPLVTSKWPSKCSAIIVYYMYWVSCKSNNI